MQTTMRTLTPTSPTRCGCSAMAVSNDERNSLQKQPLSTEGNFHLPDETTLAQGRINYISAISLSCNEENREHQHKKAPEFLLETQGLIAYHKQEVCIPPNRSLDRYSAFDIEKITSCHLSFSCCHLVSCWISSFVFSPWHNSSKIGSAHLA